MPLNKALLTIINNCDNLRTGALRTCTGGSMIADHKTQAITWLNVLRGGTRVYANAIVQINFNLNMAGLTLRDVGTSDAEIAQLRVNCHKQTAEGLLRRLREAPCLRRESASRRNFTEGPICEDSTFYDWLHEELRGGGLTLAQIGSSEAEIASLHKRDAEALIPLLQRAA